ncbi:MAG: exodeoxyribonuclease VII small subunit [Oscillospiraceae bacterium]
MTLFTEGSKLLAACQKELETARQKVVKLTKGPDGAPVEEKFRDGGRGIMDYQQQYSAYQQAIETYLDGIFTAEGKPYGRLQESIRYSLLAGGKRIRPVLTLEFARLGGIDWHLACPMPAPWSLCIIIH